MAAKRVLDQSNEAKTISEPGASAERKGWRRTPPPFFAHPDPSPPKQIVRTLGSWVMVPYLLSMILNDVRHS